MPISTISSYSDQLLSPAKSLWEDPLITVERNLEASAQGGPPGNGPVEQWGGPGSLAPFATSGSRATCARR